jgi:hypothetical protein
MGPPHPSATPLDEADGGVLAFRKGQTTGGVMFRLRMCCLLAAAILSLSGVIRSASSQPAPAGDEYTARIQTIFDGRCIACHSCYNAPCQLNLQSHSGVARGATKLNVYDGSRPTSVAPSGLDIDGHSVPDWRAKGFFEVVAGTEPARSLLMQLVSLRARHQEEYHESTHYFDEHRASELGCLLIPSDELCAEQPTDRGVEAQS